MYVECDCGYLITELVRACHADNRIDCRDTFSAYRELVCHLFHEVRQRINVERPVFLCLRNEKEDSCGSEHKLALTNSNVGNTDGQLNDNVFLHLLKVGFLDVRSATRKDELSLDNTVNGINEVIVH